MVDGIRHGWPGMDAWPQKELDRLLYWIRLDGAFIVSATDGMDWLFCFPFLPWLGCPESMESFHIGLVFYAALARDDLAPLPLARSGTVTIIDEYYYDHGTVPCGQQA